MSNEAHTAARPLPPLRRPAYERMMTATPGPAPLSDRLTAEVSGHRLDLLFGGTERMDRMIALIDGAALSIDIVMYIFEEDDAGRRVLDRLVAAARRGVRVRAVIDSFGSGDTSDGLFDPLREAGGSVTFFSRRWRSTYLIRNHQKLLLIDARVAITGGFNIADAYLSDGGEKCWFDIGLFIEGPSLPRLSQWFDQIHDYSIHHDGKLLMLRRMIREWPLDKGPVQWLVGGPTERLSPWARAVRNDLDRARRLDMAMAYFSPGQGMLRRLGRVAKRGTARFVMAGKSDNPATIGASRLLYGYLLRKKADVWEYQPCRLHMKLIVIDDVVYIGSANFDMRSLFMNLEVMARIADAGFAQQMRAFVAGLKGDCEIVTPAVHKKRGTFLTRIRWFLAWFVVGFADYTVTRRLNFGLAERDPRIEAWRG